MARGYSMEDLSMAVSAVREGGCTVYQAVKTYGVSYGAIWRRINGQVRDAKSKRGPEPGLGIETEMELRDTILELQKIGLGLTRKEILEIAAKTDAKRDVPIFKSGRPSNRWYQRFMARHNLSLRAPENLSVARMNMASIEVRDEFFDTLTSMINEHKFDGRTIYNMDESGLQLVMKSRKVAALKGSKTVYVQKSGERSENITVVACANAVGSVILPPMLIFRGETLNEDLMEDAPEGTVFSSSPKGYMVTELFYEWFVKFVNAIPPKRPVLLLLDGHSTHITREVIVLAKENQIHLLCLPPHTTHLFQPLDVGLFKPLKDAFKENADKRMRRTQKTKMNRYDFCKVFRPSWYAAATPANIVGSFSGAGVWPLDRERVRPERLIGSVLNNLSSSVSEPSPSSTTASSAPSPSETPSALISTIRELFAPIPQPLKKPSRAVTKTRCLTSDEFLAEMVLKENQKKMKQPRQGKNKRKRPSSSDEDNSDCADDPEVIIDVDGEDDALCGTCKKSFSSDCHGENWFCCCRCKAWHHFTCQKLPNNCRKKMIICNMCDK